MSAYEKLAAFTGGDDESGMQPAAFGDLIGVSGEETLPGSYKIGSAAEEDVYAVVA